jgi:rod shape-determining protein MreC
VFKFKKKTLIYFSAVVLSLLLISGAITALRSPALSVLKFPLNILILIRREIGGMVFYHRNYIENEILRKETDFLKQKLRTVEDIYLENKRLSNLLSLKQRSPYKVIAARVISRSADSWSSLIMIDKGSYHGIRRGFVVISYLGLIGRVVEVNRDTSKIMLLNDPNTGVAAMVGRSRQEGVVSGTMGSALVMRYLSPDADIKVSDTILTSGLTAVYPKGLLVGTVVRVGEEFSGLSRYAVIKPAVNLSNTEEVLIIIP